MSSNAKTTQEHWDKAWVRRPRMRLPSRLRVGTRNIQRLLDLYLYPGMRVLEIGCAPGKILAWAAKVRNAKVSGIDFSAQGIQYAKCLFSALGVSGDLRCEDVFKSSFPEGYFDLVFSCGVIEHFNDPKDLIEIHVKMLKPVGKALIIIPNYAGVYGQFQRRFDPDNLALHNLNIMSQPALVALAPAQLVDHVRTFPFGRLSNDLLSLGRVMPRWVAGGISNFLNLVGLFQPADIPALSPFLVLEMARKVESP